MDKCHVTGSILDPEGKALTKATVRFTMTTRDQDGLTVIMPSPVVVDIGSDGLVEVDLWPNSRGHAGTWYKVSVLAATVGSAGMTMYPEWRVVVPDAEAANLTEISELVPPPVVDDARAAAIEAGEYTVEARGYRDAAEGSAAAARLSEGNAAASANAASGSAGQAVASATAAATSVTQAAAIQAAAEAAQAAANAAATNATGAAISASTSSDNALTYAEALRMAAGVSKSYGSYAEAKTDVANIPANAHALVFRDETVSYNATVYQKVGGALEFVADLSFPTNSNAPWKRAKLALIFDDGYQNNITIALPILQKYGFAATIALEVNRVSQNYNGDPNRPVVTPNDMRRWVRAGGEICNHPSLTLTDTEAQMAAAAKAENDMVRQLLTGELVWDGAAFVPAPLTFPEFSNYRVTGGAYRGGARNVTSDRAYYTVFDKVRTINGPVASRGDGLMFTDAQGDFPRYWSAKTIDPSGDATQFQLMLGFVRGIASAGLTGAIYAHFTPATEAEGAASFTPYITAPQLEELCRACHENGVEIVPWSALGLANIVANPWFDQIAGGSFNALAGDTAAWDDSDRLNSMSRSIVLTATANRAGGNRPRFMVSDMPVQPFTRYRARVRYKIDTDLIRQSSGNNEGLWLELRTLVANSPADIDMAVDAYTAHRPDPAFALPYQATNRLAYDGQTANFSVGDTITGVTSGATAVIVEDEDQGSTGSLWLRNVVGVFVDNEAITGAASGAAIANGAVERGYATAEYILYTGNGSMANLTASLNACVGTVHIGALSLEKMDSLERRPLTIRGNYNTIIGRSVYLGSQQGAGRSRWRWDVKVQDDDATETYTAVNYAAEASADIAAPSAGQTVYVLGKGAGSFALHGGQIGTYDGTNWGNWATPANATLIRAANGEGAANAYYLHQRRASATFGGQFSRLYSNVYVDRPIVRRKSASEFSVFCTSGARTDGFVAVCRPVFDA